MVCRMWKADGRCVYGNACKFEHSRDRAREIVGVKRMRSRSPVLKQIFSQPPVTPQPEPICPHQDPHTGVCPYGAICHYSAWHSNIHVPRSKLLEQAAGPAKDDRDRRRDLDLEEIRLREREKDDILREKEREKELILLREREKREIELREKEKEMERERERELERDRRLREELKERERESYSESLERPRKIESYSRAVGYLPLERSPPPTSSLPHGKEYPVKKLKDKHSARSDGRAYERENDRESERGRDKEKHGERSKDRNTQEREHQRCHNCRTDLPPNAHFCLSCGSQVVTRVSRGEVNCPACRTPLPPGAKFCLTCGTPTNLRTSEREGTTQNSSSFRRGF